MDSAIAEASPFVRAQSNLSMLKLDQMAASLPDYMRLVSEGEADWIGNTFSDTFLRESAPPI